jgi:hypothetical protein
MKRKNSNDTILTDRGGSLKKGGSTLDEGSVISGKGGRIAEDGVNYKSLMNN